MEEEEEGLVTNGVASSLVEGPCSAASTKPIKPSTETNEEMNVVSEGFETKPAARMHATMERREATWNDDTRRGMNLQG